MSGRVILGAVGAVIGFYFGGPAGAQMGWMIGYGIGTLIDPQQLQGATYQGRSVQGASDGQPRAIVFGSDVTTGAMMDSEPAPRVHRANTDEGKGGPEIVNDTALLTYAIEICDSSELRGTKVEKITAVWEDEKLVYDIRPGARLAPADSGKWAMNKRFHYGGEDQEPDPALVAIHGADNTPAYCGTCYMVAESEDMVPHGERVPIYRFLVSKCSASVPDSVRFLGTGVAYNGLRAAVRPMTYGGLWVGDADTEVLELDDTAIVSAVRYGDKIFALADYDYFRVADISNLGSWSNGPAISESNASIFASGTRLFFWSDNSTLKYLNDPGDPSLTTGHTFSGGFTSNEIASLAGDGINVVVANGYGSLWGSTDNGDSFVKGAELFYPDRFYTYMRAMDCGGDGRFVIGGKDDESAAAYFTDDVGQTATKCVLTDLTAAMVIQVKYCGASTWLLAMDSTAEGKSGLYRSANNGATFDPVTLPHNVYFSQHWHQSIAVDGFSGRVVIAGTELSTGARRYYFSDNLVVWVEISTEETNVAGIVALYPFGDDEAIISGIAIPDAPGYYVDPITGQVSGPSISVETECDASLADIEETLYALAGLEAPEIDVEALEDIRVKGFAVQGFVSVTDALGPLRQFYFHDCPEYDEAIHAVLRGGDVVMEIDPDDVIQGESTNENGTRGQSVEFPRKINLRYLSPELDYKPTTQVAERWSPDVRAKGEETVDAMLVAEDDEAAKAVHKALKVLWNEREDSREIAVPIDYVSLVPSDRVGYMGRHYRIDAWKLVDGGISLKLAYDRKSAYTSGAVAIAPTPRENPTSSLFGPTHSAIANLPVLRDVDDKAGIYWAAAGQMPNWRGAQLQLSRDSGATWENGPAITAACTMGALTADLPTASRYAQDWANTLSVRLHPGAADLDSVSHAEILAEANVFAILYPDGTAEIGQFEVAVETAEREYDLTGLMRGRQDTVAGEHLAGAQFVLLDDKVRFVAIRPDDVGKTLLFRAVTLGTDASLNVSQTITMNTIESLREWQPYNVRLLASDGGGYCVEWIGRARLGSSRMPVHSQLFDGYRATFTIAGNTAQGVCIDSATLASLGSGVPQVTVVARSRVATNDDDFDSPPGEAEPGEANYPATIIGGPSDMYVGEPVFEPLGPQSGSPFQAYGGLWEELFLGEIVANVIPQSQRPGDGVVQGVPLSAETRNADAELIPSGPLVVGGPFTITDSVTVAAKPAYAMMDESTLSRGSSLATAVTTPARTTKIVPPSGFGGIRSRAGFSTGKRRCVLTIALPNGGKIAIGVHAGSASSRLSQGVAGHFAVTVSTAGTYSIETDAATGATVIREIAGGTTIASGTVPLTYSYDGNYRFAWNVVESAPGATVHANMGNEAWPDTPSSGYGGVPNVDMIVPCGFDAAVGEANGYRLRGSELSLIDATSGPSGGGVGVYAYAAFGKSSGQWRIGMTADTTARAGFCKAGHTGLLGASGTADSIGFTDTRSAAGYIIETSFGGAFNRITLPQFSYYTLPLVRFAFDIDAGTLAIYVCPETSTTYDLLVTLTGVPSGTWLPAVSGRGQLFPEIAGPGGFSDWTITI